MNEKFCPHCGKTMVNPIGQMFYCPDDCDLRAADAGSQEIPSEREFQIGDRVVVINNIEGDPGYEIGNIFIIKDFREHIVNEKTLAICKNEDDGNLASIYIEELELCPLKTTARKPGEFHKNDKVRIVKKLDGDNCYGVGDEFYIIEPGHEADLGPTLKCSLCKDGSYECTVYPDELKLIEAAN